MSVACCSVVSVWVVFVVVFGSPMELALLNWNVRGLNNPAKRRVVQSFVADLKCNVVCLQETKLASVSQTLVSECLGSRFCKNFVFKPFLGTPGEVLVAVSDDFQISKFVLAPDLFSLTGLIQDRTDGSSWTITAVYGPNDDGKKIQFMQELQQIKQVVQAEWLIAGDFNLISRVSDKSNDNVDLRMMGRFRVVLDDLELIDLPISGRRFTWSNEREDVTLSRIDRILISKEWELKFLAYQLCPASTAVSDHCPLFLKKMNVKHYRGFRFESYWLSLEGFKEIVAQAWAKPLFSSCAIRRLHVRLSRAVKALSKWSRELKKKGSFARLLANEVIFRLDLAQEDRPLSSSEVRLRKFLKARLLGFTAIDRVKWRQRSRITWIKEGDSNSKFFHIRANGRRRKNHISMLCSNSDEIFEHDGKAGLLRSHFVALMGTSSPREVSLDFQSLQVPRRDLSHLDEVFSLEEIKAAVDDMHAEKAPGPDGFIGAFFLVLLGYYQVRSS